ncbi:hypothetical protein [Micromonospora arborensis]|uniref:hypothetical protein n=1 Tax=Micromonospora arborensis TaxID=2116518 RepID=UPI00371EA8F2
MLGATLVVAVGHAGALRRLALSPAQFTADVALLFRPVVKAILGPASARSAQDWSTLTHRVGGVDGGMRVQ